MRSSGATADFETAADTPPAKKSLANEIGSEISGILFTRFF